MRPLAHDRHTHVATNIGALVQPRVDRLARDTCGNPHRSLATSTIPSAFGCGKLIETAHGLVLAACSPAPVGSGEELADGIGRVDNSEMVRASAAQVSEPRSALGGKAFAPVREPQVADLLAPRSTRPAWGLVVASFRIRRWRYPICAVMTLIWRSRLAASKYCLGYLRSMATIRDRKQEARAAAPQGHGRCSGSNHGEVPLAPESG